MLRVALCDDDSLIIQHYAMLIMGIAQRHKIEIELSRFENGEALLFHWAEAPDQIDIIYLDIAMAGTDGMQTARNLRADGCKAQIVFLTGHEGYVYEAFEVDAVQYLLKDNTDLDRFEKTFLRAVELASTREEELFLYEFDGQTVAVPLNEIVYFEIWKRLVTVHCENGQTGKFYSSMEQLEEQLSGKGFARTHRSYLVHLSYIAVFQKKTLQLKTGEKVPVGVTYAQSLRQTFSDYIARFHVLGLRGEGNDTCSSTR